MMEKLIRSGVEFLETALKCFDFGRKTRRQQELAA